MLYSRRSCIFEPHYKPKKLSFIWCYDALTHWRWDGEWGTQQPASLQGRRAWGKWAARLWPNSSRLWRCLKLKKKITIIIINRCRESILEILWGYRAMQTNGNLIHWYLQASLSSETAEGSSGLLCRSCSAYSMCNRGTSEAGGLWALCSSTVSMLSVGSRKDDASLQHRFLFK